MRNGPPIKQIIAARAVRTSMKTAFEKLANIPSIGTITAPERNKSRPICPRASPRLRVRSQFDERQFGRVQTLWQEYVQLPNLINDVTRPAATKSCRSRRTVRVCGILAPRK